MKWANFHDKLFLQLFLQLSWFFESGKVTELSWHSGFFIWYLLLNVSPDPAGLKADSKWMRQQRS